MYSDLLFDMAQDMGKETYGEAGWRLGLQGVRCGGETVRDKHTVGERHTVLHT